MKYFILFLTAVVLAGCGTREIEIDTKPTEIKWTQPADASPVKLEKPTWRLITEQNAKQAIDELTNRKARLQDPAYLRTIVRARLNYVFPGEIGFVVLDKETSTAISDVPGALVPNNDAAWYSKLWLSTKLADQPKLKNDPLVVKTPTPTP